MKPTQDVYGKSTPTGAIRTSHLFLGSTSRGLLGESRMAVAETPVSGCGRWPGLAAGFVEDSGIVRPCSLTWRGRRIAPLARVKHSSRSDANYSCRFAPCS